jgi:hypothetical protein
MKLLLCVVVALLASGCATPAAPIDVPGIERSAGVRVTDLRPASESQGETFSVLVTSDAYGTSRVAQDVVQPPPLRLLQHRIHERFGASGEALDLKVHHFVVYRNIAGPGKRVALGSIGGAIGAVVAESVGNQAVDESQTSRERTAFDAASGDEEWKRATFSADENPKGGLCFIVYIDAEFRGRRVFTRTAFPAILDDINRAIPLSVDAAVRAHVEAHAR